MLSLSAPGVAAKVAKQLLADVDTYCATKYDDGHRKHLGASLIGDACSRKLWYTFRWAHHVVHSGQQQRLFNRGHREEDRFVEWLRGIGCTVYDRDPNSPLDEDGLHAQYRINGVWGHFGGSLDGLGYLPARYGINEAVLFEFKTNGHKKFPKLAIEKMPVAKPLHYAQTSTYGFKYGFNYAAYLNICKDTDELYIEMTKLDWRLGQQMEVKAERIITSDRPPPRLSNNPTFQECSWCDFKGICHEGKPYDRNCRSCKYARAVVDKQWFCVGHNAIIPSDCIPVGCQHYEAAL